MHTLTLFKNSKEYEMVPAGRHIFDEGQHGDLMYVVIEGEAEIRVRDRTVDTVGPGGILGEMALIDEKPRSATAIAKVDCKLVPIDQRRFTFLVQETPFFSLHVMKVMADRLRQMNAQI